MEHHALKNVNNCLNTNIYSYLETSGGQSSNLYFSQCFTRTRGTEQHYLFVNKILQLIARRCKLDWKKVSYECSL